MKRWWLLPLALASLLLASGFAEAPPRADTEASGKRMTLETLTEQFYQASIDGNRQLAYSYLQKLTAVARDESLRREGEPAGWERIDDALASAAAGIRGADGALWREEASRLKLAVDALAGDRQALWLQYELLLREDLRRLEKAWGHGGPEGAAAAEAALTVLERHAARLETAAYVAERPERMTLLKERIRYARKLIESAARSEANGAWAKASFGMIGAAADELFRTEAQPAMGPTVGRPSWQWTFTMAAIIMTALVYTGWRKYRFYRDGITVPRRPHS